MLVSDAMQATKEVVHVDENLLDAAIRLRRNKLPAVAVVDGDEVVGILTEAAIAERAASADNDLAASAARDLMSAKIGYCRASEDVEAAEETMTEQGHAHLLVTARDGKLCGLLSRDRLPGVRSQRLRRPAAPAAGERVVKTPGRAKGDKLHRPSNYSVTPKLKD